MRDTSGIPAAVVDTNLFVSGLIFKLGQPARLIERFRNGSFALLLSHQLRDELEEVLGREKFATKYGLTEEERAAFLFLVDTRAATVDPLVDTRAATVDPLVDTRAATVDPLPSLPVAVRDPKDEKVLAVPLGGRADYLVTGDDDLLVLSRSPVLENLRIVTVREFLQILSDFETP